MKRMIVAALAVASLVAVAAAAQEKKPAAPKPETAKPQAQEQPKMSPEARKAMEAYEKAAQPGPNHKFLAQFAGTWVATSKWWTGPGEPEVSKGVSENRMILGGRYLQERYEGAAMGKPFHGMGLIGFDNVSKEFVSIWVDDISTGIMTGTATLDASGKVLNSVDTMNDPLTGRPTKSRSVLKVVSADEHIMEMYGPGPDGKEMLVMEITYVRKK